jgi:hypothetical protein
MGRLGKGVVVAGVAAWVTPEILIATPAGAWTSSGQPECQDKDGDNDDCDPHKNPDPNGDPNGNNGDPNGDNRGNNGDQNGPQRDSNAGSNSVTPPQYSAAGSGSSLGPTLASAQGNAGGSLPLTGSNLAADAAVGSTLVGGGWLLTRWAAARRAKPLTDVGDAGEDPVDN